MLQVAGKWGESCCGFHRLVGGLSGAESVYSAPHSADVRSVRLSLVAQMVKCLPTTRKTWVRSLGQEDPLEKEMAIHSSILAWRIPWTEEPGGLQSMGLQRVGYD